MENETHFYVLVDPRFPVTHAEDVECIRYVGKTVQRPNIRLNSHIKDARRGVKRYVCNWIRLLLSQGLEPEIQVFFSCSENWQELERNFIRSFREDGFPLTNLAVGGEGAPGCRLSEARRRKLLEAVRGRVVTPETRAKMRASALARIERDGLDHHRRLGKMSRGRKLSLQAREHMRLAQAGSRPSRKCIEASVKARLGKKKAKRNFPQEV